MANDFLSDEDKALFRDHMQTVKPLHDKTKRISQPKAKPLFAPKKSQRQSVLSKEAVTHHHLSDFISETVFSETVLSYVHSSLSSKRFRDLKNGLIRWEAKLDLHGFQIEAARAALVTFIQSAMDKEFRCVLIVHGKGGHLGAPPVIKNIVNRWLPQFDEVLAFHSAKAKDGGHGAVYVMLKKRK